MSRDGGIFSGLKESLNLGLFTGQQPQAQLATQQVTPQARVPITQQPGFASGLGRLGLTLLAAGEQGRGVGEGLLAGFGEFEGTLGRERERIAAEQLAQQQAQTRQLTDLLTLSQITQLPAEERREVRELEIKERRLDIDIRDIERKEQKTAFQQNILQRLLPDVLPENTTSTAGIETNITQGGPAAISGLQAERNKLLAGLAVPEIADLVKAKIATIDDQIKFQRSLDKENRKQLEKLSPENAAKLSLVKVGRKQLSEGTALLKNKDGTFNRATIAAMRGNFAGTKGRRARVKIMNAINAQLRAESGAAVPEEEVDRAFERFVPSILDDDATIKAKISGLDQLLSGTLELAKGPQQQEDLSRLTTEQLLEMLQ